jgi:O-acetylserine/cysteine efflux transporter
MAVGAGMLFAFSAAVGEARVVPERGETAAALGYLVVVGSVFMFMGFLYILARWPASAVSYSLLFMPLVTVPAAALLRAEPISFGFLGGGALVLAGVYLGALAPPIRLPGLTRAEPPPEPGSAAIPAIAAAEAEGQPSFVPPNCP